jgi:tetratricopeptide (TPR) repeat protein
MGQIRMAQKQYLAAIEILKHAASLDTKLARTFQLLGEAYLLSKQGTLGVAALNEAIRLDPQGMAECHLQIAHLYELAGAKQLAAKEYKLFLEKVPDHKDKKRLEKYIKDNPE